MVLYGHVSRGFFLKFLIILNRGGIFETLLVLTTRIIKKKNIFLEIFGIRII